MKHTKLLLRLFTFVIVASLLIFFYIKIKYVKDKKNLAFSVDKIAQKHVNDGKAIGLYVGIVKNGKIYQQGYGSIKKGESILPDSNTVFELASTSKLFTTSVLQILSDEKVLELDAPIAPFLKNQVILPEIAQKTTLLHLATHSSGFPSLPESFLVKMQNEKNPYKDLTMRDMYDYLKTCDGKQADGTFEYSNFGMGLLGHILELITETKYEALVMQKLLAPLQMKNTFVTSNTENQNFIAQGYNEVGAETPVWEDQVLTGAGSFLSNGADMLKFIKANLECSASPVSSSLLNTHAQQEHGDTGLGWILPSKADKLLGNEHIVWHNGMAGGYASFICIDKFHKCGVVILSNQSIDVTKLGMKLAIITRTQSWKEDLPN